MSYSTTKFEVATSNGLGDTFTRNMTEGCMDRQRMDDFGTKLMYPFFLKKKAVIKICNCFFGDGC